MDVVSTFFSVVSLINEIAGISGKIGKNQREIQKIVERLTFIRNILEDYTSKNDLNDSQQNVIKTLANLLEGKDGILQFVQNLLNQENPTFGSSLKSVFRKVINFNKIAETISDFNQDLDRMTGDLTFLFVLGNNLDSSLPQMEFQFTKDPEAIDSDDERALLGKIALYSLLEGMYFNIFYFR